MTQRVKIDSESLIGKQRGLQIISINVNGLNAQNKRGRIFKQLQKLKTDILCLQETHIKDFDHRYLSCPKLEKLFYALDLKKKKRGVATYTAEELKPKLIDKTPVRRILVMEIMKDEQKLFLMNIYAPNEKQSGFFLQITCNIEKI